MYSTGKSWEIKLLLQFIHEHLEIVCVKYVENHNIMGKLLK